MTSTPSTAVPVSLGDRSYQIDIETGLLTTLGERLTRLGAKGRVGIVTDSHVGPLYARAVSRSLKAAGLTPFTMTVPAGERAKSVRWWSALLDRLVATRCERSTYLLALGGGVVGDLTGYVAASYLRGMPFVQVPTTVIAQVDSSVGGKTGLNHASGKNLIGAFYQPRAVWIDPATLKTLPKRELLAGLSEVVKYGVIADAALFEELEQRMDAIVQLEPTAIARMIQRSCEIKAEVVAADEREGDLRRILNYGHTIGHALETLGNYRTWVHGEAVAIGMVQEASLAASMGYCDPAVAARIERLLVAAGLPTALPRVTERQLWAAMQHDKKVAGGTVFGVWPERIGAVKIAALTRAAFAEWFRRHTRRR
ncbi:MAG: 3-dehydroquinate synthase [Nitrospiraceae bacterium]